MRIGALGDVLLTRRLCFSLSVAGLRSTLLAPSRHASLLRADPWIDGVLDSESPEFAEAFNGSWPGDHGFEAAFVISNSAELEKAAHRAAEHVIRLSPSPERDHILISRQWAAGASGFGSSFDDALPDLPTDARGSVASDATLIHPGSGSRDKNWPVERFVELARRLEPLGHQVAWILGPAEANLASSLPGRIIDRPSLPVLAATLARSRVVVGNDSGVSHLAGATGARTLALFGPTDPRVWSPDGARVRTLRAPSSRLTDLSVDAAIEAVASL